MITPKTIVPETYEHFDPSGKSIGLLNELEHIDLRIQIEEESVSGYYFIADSEKIFIR